MVWPSLKEIQKAFASMMAIPAVSQVVWMVLSQSCGRGGRTKECEQDIPLLLPISWLNLSEIYELRHTL